MLTGETVSKTKNRLMTVAAATGSAVIIALSAAFVAVDFNDFYVSSAFTVNNSTVEALEPIRSDPMSEQNSTDNGSDGNGNGSDGNGDGSGNPNGAVGTMTNDDDSDNNDDDSNHPDHGLPCLDTICPIHHGTIDDNPIHHTPCDDPDCPICNGHGLPCDDPDCPVHHGNNGNDDNNRPPADISMETISFKPNSSEYADKAAAEKVLSDYVASIDHYFSIYPDDKIYLVGCIAKTANWSLTETELSEQRANAVRQTLIDLGISEDKLVAIGVGINDPWRSDEWTKGYFDEETAKLNRRVWVIPDQYDEQVALILATDELIDSLRETE